MKTECIKEGIYILQELGFDGIVERMLEELSAIEGRKSPAPPVAEPARPTEAEFIAWLDIIGFDEAKKLEECIPWAAEMPDSHQRKDGAILMRDGLRLYPSALTHWMIHRR